MLRRAVSRKGRKVFTQRTQSVDNQVCIFAFSAFFP